VNRNGLLKQILSGRSDSSIPFDPLCRLLESLGLVWLPSGTHNVFAYRPAGPDVLDVRLPPHGNMARPNDVRLVREFLRKYSLADS
jgi:hypothetical protein